MKWINLSLIIILVIGIVGLSGCTSSNNNTTTQNTTQTQSTPVDNAMFENQYVKFKKPDGLTITDKSNSTKLDISFNQGDKAIGSITTSSISQSFVNDIIAQSNKTKVANKTAYEFSDPTTVQTYIMGGILLQFDPTFSSQYKTVKDSLVIIKIPTQ